MDIDTLVNALGLDRKTSLADLLGMDDEDLSVPDSPELESGNLTPGQSAYERQRASLQTYLNHVPYKCESIEEMQARLETIVGRISICAQTKNWLVLTTWDGMLQWCVMSLHTTNRIFSNIQT